MKTHTKFLVIALIVFLPLTGLVQPFEGEKGDVNNDGSINVLDMLAIANHILGIAMLDEQERWRADCNGPEGNCDGDGSANVLDMVKIANIIMGNDACPEATVIDIDGNMYKTVTIGTQVWMGENLKVTRYRNGDAIPEVMDDSQWCHLSSGAYCNYDNSTYNAEIYGRLYNWYAVNDERGIAPEGWHVPTDAEWQTLLDYLGGLPVAGGKMKSAGTIEEGTGLWHSPNTGATNESGFSALPGGYRTYVVDLPFRDLNYSAYFWSSTEYGSGTALYWCLAHNVSSTNHIPFDRHTGFSVRCVRDH